jgi:hypothetical protein
MKRCSDDIFKREATLGAKYAELVAARLRCHGIDAEATELTFAETEEQIADYEDEQDVLLSDGRCLEVKSRRLAFDSDPSTFPYKTALVDTAAGWRKKKNKPIGVCVVSQHTDQMLFIPAETEPQWGTKKGWDRVRSHHENWLTVDRDLMVTFNQMLDHINGES